MRTSEPQLKTDTGLSEIAWLSSQNKTQTFHSLMHHISIDSLRGCYHKLDGKKAMGADRISKEMYGENLQKNLEGLIERMKRMEYRPQPVREVRIPKEGKAGATRPLGISSFEDKLVQKRMQEMLESIYDPTFLEWSYGFRPGRGAHDAIKALSSYLYEHEVETVIDVDLANFFGTIDHELLKDFLTLKIKDRKFIRYISRMFRAGVLSEGELVISDEGVPQGSCCSPVLANIYAHYVIDEWLEDVVRPLMQGKIQAFRYADDLIICFRYEQDAIRVRRALSKRLEKYKLSLNEDKTKMVKFSKNSQRKGEKQEVFNFLGFTFYLGKSLTGMVIPKLKTEGKRFRAKLQRVKAWCREKRNEAPTVALWKTFCAKLRGHIQYYGVSHNSGRVEEFIAQARRIVFKWLNRRSQRRSFDWRKFERFLKLYPLPKVKVHHKLF